LERVKGVAFLACFGFCFRAFFAMDDLILRAKLQIYSIIEMYMIPMLMSKSKVEFSFNVLGACPEAIYDLNL
jgi:hypothetical protein